MPLWLGPSDALMFDGGQQVQYTSVLPGGNTVLSVANAVGMGQTRREVAGEGGYFWVVEQEWWLAASALGTIVPKEGDYLTDDAGVVWYLQSDVEANGQGLPGTGLMYRVVTRQAR